MRSPATTNLSVRQIEITCCWSHNVPRWFSHCNCWIIIAARRKSLKGNDEWFDVHPYRSVRMPNGVFRLSPDFPIHPRITFSRVINSRIFVHLDSEIIIRDDRCHHYYVSLIITFKHLYLSVNLIDAIMQISFDKSKSCVWVMFISSTRIWPDRNRDKNNAKMLESCSHTLVDTCHIRDNRRIASCNGRDHDRKK